LKLDKLRRINIENHKLSDIKLAINFWSNERDPRFKNVDNRLSLENVHSDDDEDVNVNVSVKSNEQTFSKLSVIFPIDGISFDRGE